MTDYSTLSEHVIDLERYIGEIDYLLSRTKSLLSNCRSSLTLLTDELQNWQPIPASPWKSITTTVPTENTRVVITDNLAVVDSLGAPSRVWKTTLVQRHDNGEFSAVSDDGQEIRAITHWRYLNE